MIFNGLVALCITIFVLSYVFIRKRYRYWKERGIFCPTPSFPMGNAQGLGVTRHKSEICKDVYDKAKGKGQFCGMYFFIEPTALITSPELAKHILISDFDYFQNRGFYFNERDDPLMANIFTIEGSKWKNLRTKLTPTFTTGKMRMMFNTVMETADQMLDYLKEVAVSNESFNTNDIVSRYSTDVIISCAFGLSCNSLKNPDSEFRRNVQQFFAPSLKQQYSITFGNAFPYLARKLGVRVLPVDVSKFFMDVIRQTVTFRKKNGSERKDFMQLLIELQKKSVDRNEIFSDKDLAAQAFLFFTAGAETSASVMLFALYELAMNSDIQTRLRHEINRVLEKYNGEITYDAVLEMEYLDRVISESLRKYPPAENLFRTVARDYKVPNTNHVLEKGTNCLIPVYSFQRDEEYFPNSEKFDPDRFTEENKMRRPPFTYIPFGDGPRVCIGTRFGHMQIRVGVITFIKNFEIIPSAETPTNITICKNTVFVCPDRPIMLKLRQLK